MSTEDTIIEAVSILTDVYRIAEQDIGTYTDNYRQAGPDPRGQQLLTLQAAIINIAAQHFEECCGPDCSCCDTPCATCRQVQGAVAAVAAILRTDMDAGLVSMTNAVYVADTGEVTAVGRVAPAPGSLVRIPQPVGEDTRRLTDPDGYDG